MRKALVCIFAVCFAASAAASLWFAGAEPKVSETLKTSENSGTWEIAEQNPADFDKEITIVIDPGHGGMDGGASDSDGAQEKDINLAIAKALAEEMKGYPLKVVMTREEDGGLYEEKGQSIREKKREDLQRRKEIMEAEGVELAVSIHLNSFPQDEKVYGAQVFYPSTQTAGTNVFGVKNKAKIYAEAIQKSLEINIDDGREREAMPKNDILLFKNPRTNMVLVECGFLSNSVEADKLKTAEYQRILSKAIWAGINDVLGLKALPECKIIDSANGKQ